MEYPLAIHSRKPELSQRGIRAFVVDIDGCLYKGPQQELDLLFTRLNESGIATIPNTARSISEMNGSEFPGKAALMSSGFGVFEAGMQVVINNQIHTMAHPAALEAFNELKQRLYDKFVPYGPRISGSPHDLESNPNHPDAYGYYKGYDGSSTIPFRFSPFTKNEISLVMWPTGRQHECMDERDYHSCARYPEQLLDDPESAQFKNMISIIKTDGSVIIRPVGFNSHSVSKLTGLMYLLNNSDLEPNQLLGLGDTQPDEGFLAWLRSCGGISIAPPNATHEVQAIAEYVLPSEWGEAGYALLPFLREHFT